MTVDATGAVATDPGAHYARTRTRLIGLLTDLPAADWERPVPACPGWRVRDVAAHLAAVVEDALAGRLSGPPDDAQTAEQVTRYADREPATFVTAWSQAAPDFEAAVTALDIWPAAMDVLTHEHDIRHAVGRPGARDDEAVDVAARVLIGSLAVPGTVAFDLGEDVVTSPSADGPDLTLTTSAFEVLRLRLGRRSREQVKALDWSADPEPVLDHLFVFGPTPEPLVE